MKNKILFVNHSLSDGGSEKVMTIIANEFIKRNYDVSMIIIEKSEKETYVLDDKVKRYYFDPKNKKGSDFVWTCIKYIRKIIRDIKPDVIVSFMIRINIMTIIADFGIKNKLLVSERAAPAYRKEKREMLHFLENTLYNFTTAVIVQTNQVKDMFVAPIRRKCVVIANPIQPNLPTAFHGQRENSIVALGRLTKQKNFEMLIKAFANCSTIIPDYSLKIYGDGEEREHLGELIYQLKMEDRIHLMGYVADVNQQIRDAAIYVSSSNFEGISNAMLEAMAIGLPVVCTDCPVGGAAMAIDDSNGILIPVGDQKGLENAIKRIVNDSEFAEKIGRNAEKVRNRFSVENIVNQWEAVFSNDAAKEVN